MNASLDFGLDLDRDYSVAIASLSRWIYWPLSVFLLNPVVIFVLVRKTHMSIDCKAAFVAHHIVLICFDVYNGLLYQMYPLAPIPIFICRGVLCTDNTSPRLLLTILAFLTITMCVPYLFIMTRMHQKMLFHDSPFKLSMRAQIAVLLALITTLLANLVGFACLSTENEEKSHILEKPSVSWVREVSENFLVLGGAPGDVGDFVYELILLGVSILINFSYYVFITYHAVFKLGKQMARNNENRIQSKTRDAQLRFIYSLTIQACLTAVFFITPLALLFIALLIDLSFIPGVLMALARPVFLMLYSLCSFYHSAVFLVKNPWCIQQFKRFVSRSEKRKQQRHNSTTIRSVNAFTNKDVSK